MKRWIRFARRAVRARKFGVLYKGTSHTSLPEAIVFGGEKKVVRVPGHPMIVADFINVVLDDEYGVSRLPRPPRTVVDIGANVGMFTNFVRGCFPDAVIHAYEPSPRTAEQARFNTAHPQTVLYEEGVASTAGRASLVECGPSNLAQTRVDSLGEIRLAAFETVLERIGGQIDLLKVDCEGAEWDFMRDPAHFAQVGCIRMEYHLTEGRSLADLERLAQGIGFRIARLMPNQGFGIAWLDPADLPSGVASASARRI